MLTIATYTQRLIIVSKRACIRPAGEYCSLAWYPIMMGRLGFIPKERSVATLATTSIGKRFERGSVVSGDRVEWQRCGTSSATSIESLKNSSKKEFDNGAPCS